MDARFPLTANLPEDRHGMIIMVCALSLPLLLHLTTQAGGEG